MAGDGRAAGANPERHLCTLFRFFADSREHVRGKTRRRGCPLSMPRIPAAPAATSAVSHRLPQISVD